MKIHIASEI